MKSKLWELIHKWRDATTTESAWIARDQIDIELDKIEAAMTQERKPRKPLTHEQAKTLAATYDSDPLHLIWQVEQFHGIKE